MQLDNWVWGQSVQLEDWIVCEWAQLGGLGLVPVGAVGKTGAGSSWCGWEDWGWCQLVQLGNWDDFGGCGWGTRMALIGAAGKGR